MLKVKWTEIVWKKNEIRTAKLWNENKMQDEAINQSKEK